MIRVAALCGLGIAVTACARDYDRFFTDPSDAGADLTSVDLAGVDLAGVDQEPGCAPMGGWVPYPVSLPYPRTRGAAVAVGNHIYYMGGYDAQGTPQNDVWELTPPVSQFIPVEVLPLALARHAAVVDDSGAIWVSGGLDVTGGKRATVYRFDGSVWKPQTSTQYVHSSHGFAAAPGPQLYVFDSAGTCEVFDGSMWSSLPCSTAPRDKTVAVTDGIHIWLLGGLYGTAVADVDAYDLVNRVWMVPRPMPMPGPRQLHSAVLVGPGRLLVMGGLDESSVAQATTFAHEGGTWQTLTYSLPEARSGSSAVRISDGTIFLLGGEDSTNAAVNTIYTYCP